MFLKELNKKEAAAFVNLIENLSKADNVYAECEKALIDSYVEELSLASMDRVTLPFEASVKELNEASSRIKNIIYFELVGVALLDGAYEKQEIEFLNNLAGSFNISRDKQIAYVDYFKKVINAYGNDIVDAETKIAVLEASALKLIEE